MPATEAPQKETQLNESRNGTSAPVDLCRMEFLQESARFARRHIGPNPTDTKEMLSLVGFSTLEDLVNEAVPASIRLNRPLQLPRERSEHEVLAALKEIASQNQVFRS